MSRLLLLSGFIALASVLNLASDASAQAPANITIVVSCGSNPETVKIANHSRGPVTIVALTSLHEPKGDEPFLLNNLQLGPGLAATYVSGPAATAGAPNTLTRQEIFANDAREGVSVIVETPIGRTNLPVLCSAGSGSFNVGATIQSASGPAAPAPTAAAAPGTTTSTTGQPITPPSTGNGGLK